MNRVAFFNLINAATGTGVKVWEDFIPEKQKLPACSYKHIADGGSRVLNGKRVGEWDTWRVTITGKSRTDYDAIMTTLKGLDNTKAVGFKNIFVMVARDVPANPDDKIRSGFIDPRVYNG